MKNLHWLALPWLLAAPATGQSGTLIKDINVQGNPAPVSSYPGGLGARSDGIAIFHALHPQAGHELWRTDGTMSGTYRVRDIYPGYISSYPGFPCITADDTAFFVATSPGLGKELWKTDGSFGGTDLVKDIRPGPEDGSIFYLRSMGTDVLFLADDGTTGLELWRSDGTEAGTQLVTEVVPGPQGIVISFGLGSLGSSGVVFAIDDGVGGQRLWTSDGTAAGTREVVPQSVSSIRNFFPFGNRTLMHVERPGTGFEPWITDGTAAGTFALGDLVPGPTGSGTSPFYTNGSLAFFAADGPTGIELYQTDGTVLGTTPYADIAPGPLDSSPDLIGAFGSEIVFSADDGSGDRDLFRTDLATSSVVWLSEAETTSTYTAAGANYAGVYVFEAVGPDGREPWRTDGTPAGTYQLADVMAGPNGSIALEYTTTVGGVVFCADDGVSSREPWITDGTPAGTMLLKDINDAQVTSSSRPLLLGRFQEKMYFRADDGIKGAELWSTDGTEAGTTMLVDAWPGSTGGYPGPLAATDDFAVFASRTAGGNRAWLTDGTPGGTKLLGTAGNVPTSPSDFTTFGDRVFFAATHPSSGAEVWSTDGTQAGTGLFKDLRPGTGNSYPEGFFANGDKLYFWATAGGGTEPWVSYGTNGTTFLLMDIRPGAVGSHVSSPENFVALGDEVFFVADDGVHGDEIWKTIGSPLAGTEILLDIALGPTASNPRGLIAHDGALFFAADDGDGEAIWRSDGTASGTVRVAPLPGAVYGLGVIWPLLTPLNESELVFWLDDGVSNANLWKTDGTALGTQLVHRFDPSGSISLQSVDLGHPGMERAVLSVSDGLIGRGIWTTDGTSQGTIRVNNLGPHLTGGLGQHIRFGDSFLTVASDNVAGIELHKIPLTAIDDWATENVGLGCGGTGGLVPSIGMTGVARESSPTPFSVDLTNARANAPAFLLWSPFELYAPLAGGCHLYVGLPLMLEVATTDAAGNASVSFPPVPGLAGFEGHFQYAVLDPAGAFNSAFALTGKLEIVGGL